MREALDRHFTERFFGWMPYLYGELTNVEEEQERALVETGAIQAMGFRYVGEVAAVARGLPADPVTAISLRAGNSVAASLIFGGWTLGSREWAAGGCGTGTPMPVA
jgi:hypothetical protein